MNRRNFIRTSVAAAFSLPAFSILGAELAAKKYRTAIIGCGWWGGNILREAMASGACDVVALCDVDTRQMDRLFENVEQARRGRDALVDEGARLGLGEALTLEVLSLAAGRADRR